MKATYGNNTQNVELALVGVWDTVGALGIPNDLFEGLDSSIYGFLDTSLHPDVKAAVHALSIDERRSEFAPTLWTPNGSSTLEQVWFSGVHADVGGGYAETGLSDIALSWMIQKARGFGVQFDPGAYATYTSVEAKHSLDQLHTSWSLLWGFPKWRDVAATSDLADSVGIRIANLTDYRPSDLQITGNSLNSTYQTEYVVTSGPTPLTSALST